MEMSDALIQQERLQAIAEKRKRQAEIENKRRQLEDERRQVQHLKSKALRERWLLEGAQSEEDEAMKKQFQEDEIKIKKLEESIQRLEKELDLLENGDSATSTKENLAEEVTKEKEKAANNAQKIPSGSTKDVIIHASPAKAGGDLDLMKTAMYSVEITVEKDKVTGETKVLSTTTLLPKDVSQGVKVYEDDQKVVHAVHPGDGAIENGVHPLSSTEVEELIHKADEVSMSEVSLSVGKDLKPKDNKDASVESKDVVEEKGSSQKQTPRKEITGVEAKPVDGPKIPGMGTGESASPSKEQPVTMIFMGYQNVEDENETKKVLGLEGTVKAELVVIEDADNKVPSSENTEKAPPNGAPAEPIAAAQNQENQAAEKPDANEKEVGVDKDLNIKEKHRCKCCTVM
ncbi:paralemmin 1a isoform X1 [Latimeria chalumnae]|uniref:paralemmin 1a isoform X1 n=1 Tax=Latimeria chalumnae TaxID=7897 RepID=UPI0003C11983|nr:PREDICTED: paralemmin-1 isoform X1 [Latimeria chalumnae]|eukprot:XP_005991996.1 PREDICTED: paralemmin-1 isoform X1 [Latimeria chalumnae]